MVPSTVNVTVPVGVEPPDALLTEALNITELPAFCGLALVARVVTVPCVAAPSANFAINAAFATLLLRWKAPGARRCCRLNRKA